MRSAWAVSGLRLEDLATLYAALARGGDAFPLVHRLDVANNAQRVRLLDPVAAWYVGNILIGAPPPENASFGKIAFKTGTSYGYRDAWAIGFDGKRTIAIWVGRPDGQPVPGMIGRTAAAPILFDAFTRIAAKIEPLPAAPAGAIIASTAKLPLPLRRFAPPGESRTLTSAEPPVKIVFPPNGAQVALERSDPAAEPQPIAIKTNGGDRAVPFSGGWLAARRSGFSQRSFLAAKRSGLCALDGDRRAGCHRQRCHPPAAIGLQRFPLLWNRAKLHPFSAGSCFQ